MNELVKIINHDGTLVVSSREVAENFEKRHDNVINTILGLKKGLLKNEDTPIETYFIPSCYVNEQNKQTYVEYLMTRDGFSLLVMGFTGQKALDWKLKYIEAFNRMEKQLQPRCVEDLIIMQAQSVKELRDKVQAMEVKADETKAELQGIRDVVTLNPNSWRSECNTMISKIAFAMGGTEHIQAIREEIYQALNKRYAVDLEARKRNRRRRMAEEGVSKSKRDKLGNLDIIAEDKKLIEGYIMLVKEMAIKNNVKWEEENRGRQ